MSAEDRLGEKALAWLHAEAVWQRDQLRVEAEHQWTVRRQMGRRMIDADTELTEAVDLARWLLAESAWRLGKSEDSRFRWAEEAAALQAKLDLPCGSCHPCVFWDATAEPGDAEEALAAALEAQQSSIVTMDDAGPEFDAQYAARIALDLVRSWGASTSNALSNAALPADWRKQLGLCESSGAAVDLVESWLPATVEAAPPPLCEKCRCRGVQDSDRPRSVFGHFCLNCIGACHDMSDESSVHMCVIDRWTPSAAGVSGTGTEASNAE